MKIEIGSYKAKTKLLELLRQVKAGKSFMITNRGEVIADLVPSTGLTRLSGFVGRPRSIFDFTRDSFCSAIE